MNDVTINNENILPSKVELTKNTKGYTWSITIRCKDGQEVNMIDKLELLNKEMISKFKSE